MSEKESTAGDCPHWSFTGDEGPAGLLGRPVRRWKCDGCGYIREGAPTVEEEYSTGPVVDYPEFEDMLDRLTKESSQ